MLCFGQQEVEIDTKILFAAATLTLKDCVADKHKILCLIVLVHVLKLITHSQISDSLD